MKQSGAGWPGTTDQRRTTHEWTHNRNRGDDGAADHGGGRGERGASTDTPVTGDEADKVSAVVTATDSAVTVESVRKDPDGSYDVLGTKDVNPVMFDVSADLATITEHTRPNR